MNTEKGLIKKSVVWMGSVAIVCCLLIVVLVNINREQSRCNYCDQLAKQFNQDRIIK